MLIAIEGVDGAGKRTLDDGLRRPSKQAGKSVATLAFPRYGQSVTADIAAEALHGKHGDLASSVYAMAMLFALDRAGGGRGNRGAGPRPRRGDPGSLRRLQRGLQRGAAA